MTAQPVEANVVLTANNSQYDQAMNTSSQATSQLGQQVDTLGTKIANLTKTAGKGLIGISAGDVATITAATAAWSSYEKQMAQLNAQAAILGKSQADSKRMLTDYTNAVKTLRSEYGSTTAEATQLVEVLSKVTDQRNTRGLTDLSKVFTDMSHATGESADGLATSLTGLQKLMGTRINTQSTRQYADMFTYLAAQTNTSAQGLIDFTSQIAPVGRQLGLNTQQLAGFSTAFAKAGQDGSYAANTFTKMTGDIAYAMQSGSPSVAAYANIIGKTSEQFRKMDKGEALLEIFDQLQKEGPRAITQLNRLGLDGPRALKAITAVASQPGGLRGALGLAEQGTGSGAAATGAAAATKSLNDEFDKLHQNMSQVAETMGSYFAPVMEKFMQGMVKASSVVKDIVDGPMGKFLALIMQVIAPLAGGVGALLLFAGALTKVAMAFATLRSTPAMGLFEGLKGGGAIREAEGGGYTGMGGALGPMGTKLAEGRSTWVQRGMYNTGAGLGMGIRGAWRGTGTLAGSVRGGYTAARMRLQPDWTPGPQSASLGEWAAGMVGTGINEFVTPTFDAMRHPYDPTLRRRWAGATGPLAGLRNRWRMGGAIRREEAAGQRVAALQGAYEDIYTAPLGEGSAAGASESERKQRLAGLKTMQDDAKVQHDLAVSSKTSLEQELASRKYNTTEMGKTTAGFQKLGKSIEGLAAGVGGAAVGGVGFGLREALKSPMKYPMAGTALMMGQGMFGVQSTAMEGAGMGLMFGPWGGLIGGAAGAVADARTQAQNFSQLQQTRAQALKQGDVSTYLAANQQAIQGFQPWQQQQDASYWERLTHPGRLMGNIGRGLTAGYTWLTGGGDAYGARQQAAQNAQIQGQALASALSGISTRQGTRLGRLDLSSQTDQDKLTKVMAGLQPTMDKLNISTQDIISSYKASGQGPQQAARWQALRQQLVQPGAFGAGPGGQSLWDRMRAAGGSGAAILDTAAGRRSTRLQEDVASFYEGTHEAMSNMVKSGMSFSDIMKSTMQQQNIIKNENSREYEQQTAMYQMAQQRQQMQMSVETRGQQWATQVSNIRAATAAGMPQTQTGMNELQQTQQQFESAFADQVNYIRQQLLMVDQFNKQQTRAQEDFNLQRSYAEHDYNLQRSRESYQFNLQEQRATADYYRQRRRSEYDFHLQRQRQLEDFQHSIDLAAKQMATSQWNPFQRIAVQPTASAQWTLFNMEDQLRAMRAQEKNIQELRKLGFSDATLQMLHAADPNNAQQIARFVTEVKSDRSLVGQYNQVAGQRQQAARRLYTDPANADFAEAHRSLRLSLSRNKEDFDHQMKLSHDDFERNMKQQRHDFNVMLGQQADDYQTSMDRQEHAYHQTMNRAAQDLADASKEISGSLHSLLVRGTTELSGQAQKQAQAVLDTFDNLHQSTNPVAVKIMSDLSDIFGFKYQVPKGVNVSQGAAAAKPGGPSGPSQSAGFSGAHSGAPSSVYYAGGWGGPGHHEGGTIPGYTPGRDTHTIAVGGGEAIMRPEWTRAVGGDRAVERMNHDARYGGDFSNNPHMERFAQGGTFRPVNGFTVVRGNHDQYTGYTAWDLGVPVGTPVYAVEGGRITRSYDITGYEPRRPGKQDGYRSYGRVMYLQTAGGPEVLYAHLSRRGFNAGASVTGGQAIGLSGNTGNSTGPHLHFGDSDGNPSEFITGKAGSGTIQGSVSGGGGITMSPKQYRRSLIDSVLRDFYHKPEVAAYGLQGVHPLKVGDISTVINRFARQKVAQLVQKFGVPTQAMGAGSLQAISGNFGANAQGVWNALLGVGFSKQQAAGIMGNMQSESGFDPYIVQGGGHSMNPAAAGGGGYGLVQWTPGSKLIPYLHGKRPSVATEINALAAQLSGQGSSPEGAAGSALRHARSVAEAAQAFELKYERHAGPPQANRTAQAQAIYAKYAAAGGLFDQPTNAVIGEAGPEAVIPLNARGADFLTDVMGSVMGGRNVVAAGRGVSVHNYRIDRSTNFTGPITVQANDPGELLAKLQARQRVQALSRPQLTGSAA